MKYLVLFILIIILLNLKRYKENFENSEKLMFIHIPKTAGTSVETYAKTHNIKWGRHVKYPRPVKKVSAPYWHIPPKYFNRNNSPYKGKILFAIVRNPYERIISEYKYRNEIFPKNKKNVNKKNVNKKNLNEFIHNAEIIYDKNNFCFDGHLLPQNEFVDSKTEILKIENLDKEFSNLMKKYNYPDKKLGKSFKTSTNLSVKDLDRKSINIVNNIYHEDFNNFGYTKL